MVGIRPRIAVPVHVPAANNDCEYAIGRYKLRTASMRGVKSAQGRAAIFTLCHVNLLA